MLLVEFWWEVDGAINWQDGLKRYLVGGEEQGATMVSCMEG